MWDDDGSSIVDLPFTFNYYGAAYNQLTVSTNGYVVFGDSPATSFANLAFPAQSRPNGVVAPFWDDLNPSAGGSIWWDVEGDAPNRQYVVAWELVPHYDNVGAGSFEVIFDEATQTITFQYQNVVFGDVTVDNGASATIGVEHPAGTVGRTFSSNAASLALYQQHFGIQFVMAPPGAPSILDFTLPQATVATDYNYTLQHTGGVDPVTWSIADGELPPGLSLDPATGEIAGQPTEAGTWEMTVRLTDSNVPAQTAEQLLDLEVVIGYQLTEVPFSWIDARDGGTDAGFTLDDSAIPVNLPFTFGFYSGQFSSVQISSNGYIVFGDSAANLFSNADIPNPNAPNGYAAPFWDDLSPQDGGGVWYKTVGDAPNRKFVIAWYDTPRYKQNGAATFEIVLEEGTNAIEFQYLDTSFEFSVYDYGAAATIGLENLTGSSGTKFSFNEASLQPYDGVTGLRFTVLTSGPLPPFITSIPPTSARPGQPYTYQPTASGVEPFTWSLVSGPDGMSVDPATGAVSWTPAEAGDYPVDLRVSDANGSADQNFVVSVAAGEVHTETWAVSDGWQSPPGELLSTLGTLAAVQSSDDQRLEVPGSSWASFKFSGTLPDGATIQSISVVIEYYESAGTSGDPFTWEVGNGPLDAPVALGTLQPEEVLGAPSEKAVAWDVGEWVTDPAGANDLTFVVRNPTTDGTVYLDQVRVEVVYLTP
jgi:Putative Ig domain/Nidogen-like